MKRLYKFNIFFVLLTLTFSNFGSALVHAAAGDTTRVSVASDGSQANGDSQNGPSISADGRYVVFDSFASNLVNGDTNNFSDIFIHDRINGTTMRVSVASDGTQANNQSYNPSISANGRYVAFFSVASNLVSGDTNNFSDIFVHDRTSGTTTRVSVASDGTQANEFSDSSSTSISADGRYVTFFSAASNLVSGDTNNFGDIFVHDRTTGTTTRVSVASDGTQANSGPGLNPSISANGRYVVFESDASNLVSGDANGYWDIFVHDRIAGTTTRVSVASDSTQANEDSGFSSVSADGRYVAFDSFASNLVGGDTNITRDIFVHDRTTGTTARVSVATDGTQANGLSYFPSISADGRYVAFSSYASNLVSGDTNGSEVFVHDRTTGVTTRVSIASDGTQANGGPPGLYSSISADGRYVAFDSDASNLVSGDTNNAHDIFVHELDITAPRITGTSLTASYTSTGPSNFTITFSEDVGDPTDNTGTDDVTNPANYLLVNKGINGTANTLSCSGGVVADDTRVAVTNVSYNSATFTSTVTLASALPMGSYRLFVCGTTSIVDAAGNPLNGGSDYIFDLTVQVAPTLLPATGFPMGRASQLPIQPVDKSYANTDLVLEIPSLNQKMTIVGVPQTDASWDVTWLGNNAGWLNGSAFPTWAGNTVLTGHVWTAYNQPGPFANLKTLKYGDQILIHAFGQTYTYEVRESKTYWAKTAATKVFQHEELDWVTLVTCETYNPLNGDYFFRRAVRAVLVNVK